MRVRTKQPMTSLKEHVLSGNLGVSSAPDLFCFGPLEHFDVPQLQALIAPRSVETK